MQRATHWQPLLLTASLVVAIVFAIGGWTLGRWRSRRHTDAKSGAVNQSVRASGIGRISAQNPQKPTAISDPQDSILLQPTGATLSGAVTRSLMDGEDRLIGWSSRRDAATWQFRASKPGFYSAELTYATIDAAADAELELRMDDRKRLCSLRASGSLERFIIDEYPVAVPTGGVHQLTIQPHSEVRGPWLVLRSVRLIPTKADKPGKAP
jgi:hypothetical protein